MTEKHHRWDKQEKRIPACETSSGCDQTERTCIDCGLVKITVHPPHGLPYRAWRHPNGLTAAIESTPPCLEKVLP